MPHGRLQGIDLSGLGEDKLKLIPQNDLFGNLYSVRPTQSLRFGFVGLRLAWEQCKHDALLHVSKRALDVT